MSETTQQVKPDRWANISFWKKQLKGTVYEGMFIDFVVNTYIPFINVKAENIESKDLYFEMLAHDYFPISGARQLHRLPSIENLAGTYTRIETKRSIAERSCAPIGTITTREYYYRLPFDEAVCVMTIPTESGSEAPAVKLPNLPGEEASYYSRDRKPADLTLLVNNDMMKKPINFLSIGDIVAISYKNPELAVTSEVKDLIQTLNKT